MGPSDKQLLLMALTYNRKWAKDIRQRALQLLAQCLVGYLRD